MKLRLAMLCATLLAPLPAFAGIGEGENFVDLYYAPVAKLNNEVPGAGKADSDGGKGYGVRGRYVFLPNVFAQAEYLKDSYDGFNHVPASTDADLMRAGAGVRTDGGGAYAIAEFIREKIDVGGGGASKSGWGARAGVQGALGEWVSLYGELGHADVGDFGSGLEFALGGVFKYAFVETRQIRQKQDSGSTFTFRDIRVGVRLPFSVGP